MSHIDAICSSLQRPGRDNGRVSLEDIQSWSNEIGTSIHLAVMTEPYLSKVIAGEKYIESRLTKVNISPYFRAAAGDIVLFKKSGGPILAVASVGRVMFERLSAVADTMLLVQQFADGLGYEPGYVESKQQAKFASLLWLSGVRAVPATPLKKRGRQAWVTLQPNLNLRNNAGPDSSRFLDL